MMTLQNLSSLARAGVLSLAVAAPMAYAGHTNILLTAELRGQEEVPASGVADNKNMVGDPNARGEIYVFGIDPVANGPTNSQVICYNLQVKKLAEVDQAPGGGRAAHIHEGARGQNGPVVATLAWPQGGQSADCLNGETQAARFPTNGANPKSPAALIADILANPQNYYVNVHNSAFPNGAIRGQLEVAKF